MDPNKTTIGPKGLDLTTLPIVELIPLADDSGFLMVKSLGDRSLIDCTNEDCDEFAEFAIFCASRDEEHSYAYNCSVHKDVLIALAKAGVKAYIRH